jgi:hypothetical protein
MLIFAVLQVQAARSELTVAASALIVVSAEVLLRWCSENVEPTSSFFHVRFYDACWFS